MTHHSRPRRLAAYAFAAAFAVPFVLTGCAQTPAPEPTSPPATEPVPAPETPAPTPTPTPAAFTCEELVPVSLLQSTFGGTFTPQEPPAPGAGSAVDMLVDAGGTSCAWSDDSGNVVLLAAGQVGTQVVDDAEAMVSRAGVETDVFGADLTAYSSGQGGTLIDVFSDIGAWVHTESVLFTSPAVAGPVVANVLQELPS